MTIAEVIRWWWESNVEWIRIHDPWVIPLVAVSIPLSLVIRSLSVIISVWRKK